MIFDFQRDMVETRASKRARVAQYTQEVKSLPVESGRFGASNGFSEFILINSREPVDVETCGFFKRTYSRRSKLLSTAKARKVRIIFRDSIMKFF